MVHAQAAFSGISVTDLAEAKRFYTEVLGFTPMSDEMGLRLQLPGGGELFIYDKADHQPATFTVLNLVVADIDLAIVELTQSGVTLERYDNLNLPAAQDESGVLRGRAAGQGPDIAWFKDPAGNILSVLQN